MSITDSATGGVEEPDSVISSDSQETSQGVVAEQAEAVHASEDAPAAEADKAAEQDTRDADTSEATDPIEGFENLGLPSEVLKAITKVGFETPSPIQAHTIPVLMDGHDVVGLAQTGTGKTAAFASRSCRASTPRCVPPKHWYWLPHVSWHSRLLTLSKPSLTTWAA